VVVGDFCLNHDICKEGTVKAEVVKQSAEKNENTATRSRCESK
jgi:hypothetical protein